MSDGPQTAAEPTLDADDLVDLRSALSDFDPAAAPVPVAGRGSDPFFVGRVMSVVPTRLRGARLTPTRRALVLGSFYGGALAVAAMLALLAPESVLGWSDQAHGWAHDATAAAGVEGVWASWPVVLGAVAALCGLVLALAPSRVDTPAT